MGCSVRRRLRTPRDDDRVQTSRLVKKTLSFNQAAAAAATLDCIALRRFSPLVGHDKMSNVAKEFLNEAETFGIGRGIISCMHRQRHVRTAEGLPCTAARPAPID